jgi:hypothetical protein
MRAWSPPSGGIAHSTNDSAALCAAVEESRCVDPSRASLPATSRRHWWLLEVNHPDHANLETEVAQGST